MSELIQSSKITGLPKVNVFVVKLANVNGSGSASANGMFAKAVFRMGIPISPHNIFPSNIQGLPTWFEVRMKMDEKREEKERRMMKMMKKKKRMRKRKMMKMRMMRRRENERKRR